MVVIFPPSGKTITPLVCIRLVHSNYLDQWPSGITTLNVNVSVFLSGTTGTAQLKRDELKPFGHLARTALLKSWVVAKVPSNPGLLEALAADKTMDLSVAMVHTTVDIVFSPV